MGLLCRRASVPRTRLLVNWDVEVYGMVWWVGARREIRSHTLHSIYELCCEGISEGSCVRCGWISLIWVVCIGEVLSISIGDSLYVVSDAIF